MDKLRIRLYIKTRWLLDLTATQVHDGLTAGYRPDVVSYSKVTHWVYRFSSRRESLKDDHSIISLTQQSINAIKDLVNAELNITYVFDFDRTVTTSQLLKNWRHGKNP